MSSLWSCEELKKATGASLDGDVEVKGISIDSRRLETGDLFVAIRGEQFDGHAYVGQSFDCGAAAALISENIAVAAQNAPLLKVPDTLEALVDMARFRRTQVSAKVLGVTGSVGKTSVKGMMAHMLAACGKTHATFGNLNNHIGLPLTMSRMPKDADYAVIEMGTNHPGEIAPLSALARPHVAMVTTVESVHLEHFESEQEIAREKAQIFKYLEKDGVAVLNRDNRHFAFMQGLVEDFNIAKTVTFGKHENADVRLVNYRENNANQGEIEAVLHGQELHFTLGVMGEHQALNALGVLASIDAAGVDVKKAVHALESYGGADGRGKVLRLRIEGDDYYVMDDSYNASPAAVKAGLVNLMNYGKRVNAGRIIAVLGDMFELGDTAPELHGNLAQNIVENGVNLVFTTGSLMKHLYEKLPEALRGGHYQDAPATADALQKELKAGDVVLVKGSHGMRMDKIVTVLKG